LPDNFHQTTQLYIPEEGTLHNNRCENLKSYNFTLVFLSIIRNEEELWDCLYFEKLRNETIFLPSKQFSQLVQIFPAVLKWLYGFSLL
jgi:hypothetical protein